MLSDIKHILKCVFALRLKELKNNRLFKIGVIGVIGFIIQAAFFEIFGLQLQIFSPALAALLGSELAITSNFFLNNIFTFPEQRISISKKFFKKFLQFNLAVSISLVIQWAVVSIGELVAADNFMILRGFNILGVLIGLIFNYMAYTKFIWREPRTNADRAQISAEKEYLHKTETE